MGGPVNTDPVAAFGKPVGIGTLVLFRRCLFTSLVVGRFSSQSVDANVDVRRILRKHQVQLYAEDNLPELIDEIRRTGKVLQPENEEG